MFNTDLENLSSALRARLTVLCDDVTVQASQVPDSILSEEGPRRLIITANSHSIELMTTIWLDAPDGILIADLVDEAFARLRGSIASVVLHFAGKAHKGTAGQEAEHESNVVPLDRSVVKEMTALMDDAMASMYRTTGVDKVMPTPPARYENHTADALFYAMQRPKVPNSTDLMPFPVPNPCFFTTWNEDTESYVPLDEAISDPTAPCHCRKCKSDRGEYTTEAQNLTFDIAVPGRPNNRTAADFLMICAAEYASATQSPPSDLMTACLALASRINLSPSPKVPTRAQWDHYLDVQARMARDAATLEAESPINLPPTLTQSPTPGEMRH